MYVLYNTILYILYNSISYTSVGITIYTQEQKKSTPIRKYIVTISVTTDCVASIKTYGPPKIRKNSAILHDVNSLKKKSSFHCHCHGKHEIHVTLNICMQYSGKNGRLPRRNVVRKQRRLNTAYNSGDLLLPWISRFLNASNPKLYAWWLMHHGMCLTWSSDKTFKSLRLKRKSDVSAFNTAPVCKHIPTASQFILRNHQNTGDWNDTCQPIWSQDFESKCMHVVEISVIPHVTPGFCHY
jgi:hypothetical protein